MITNNKCLVCEKGDTVLIESRSNVPVIQNITLSNVEEALDYPQGKLNMFRCNECGFVWNDKFNDEMIHYDDGYNNDVSQSKYYIQHLERMADLVISSIPENEPIHYVEVGCGNAEFLVLIAERSKGRLLSATGFDPSFAGGENIPCVATVHKSVFSETSLDLIPPGVNVICSRHTIEHIQDVHKFAQTLSSLTKYAGCKLFVETPNVDWILKNVAFQDFFYEHCSLFTPTSMQNLFKQYGIRIEVSTVYNEQYMWSEGYCDKNIQLEYRSKPCSTSVNLSKHYIEQKFELMKFWSNFISERAELGLLAIWGAASKGVTFSLLFSSDLSSKIDCAIDLNVEKQNRFLPTTALPVVSPEGAALRGVTTVIIMNPNYESEIIQISKTLKWAPEFITLNSP